VRAPLPPCEDGGPTECALTWAQASAAVPVCNGPPAGGLRISIGTCAGFDVIMKYGLDSGFIDWYDETGTLVGTNETGLGNGFCVSYAPSFSPPSEFQCTIQTPECAADAGVPGDAASD
jgi:hypothetical protein